MKASKFTKVLLLSLCFSQVTAQVTNLIPVWAKGSTSINISAEGRTIATDAAGNSYLSGWFHNADSINFGPYAVHYNSGGLGIGILAKYSPSGQVQWATALPFLFGEPGSIASDPAGNIFAFGTNSASFNPLNYIFKLDTNGVCTWVDSFPGTSVSGINPTALTTDADGNVYYAGGFQTYTFVTIGNDTLYGFGGPNYYLAKYSNNGTLQWARSSPTYYNTAQVTGVAANTKGDVYTGGTFTQKLIIGPDTLHGWPPNGGGGYVARFDTSGNQYWGRSILSPAQLSVSDVCTDSWGNVWVYGNFTDSLFFGDSLVAIGQSRGNTFVVKLNESGDLLWVSRSYAVIYQINQGYTLTPYQIVCDNNGRSYICGGTYDSIYAHDDSLIYTTNSTSSAGDDYSFVLSYDSNGHIICLSPFPHGGDDWSALAIDHSGNIFFGGDNDDGITGNFIVGADTIVPGGIFIAKFSPCGGDIGPKGITELSANQPGLSLQPNPSNGLTIVSYNLAGGAADATLNIDDLPGRGISNYALPNAQGELPINTTLFKAGIYIVSLVSQGQKLATGKLVVE